MIKNLIHSMIVCPELSKDYPSILYGKGSYIFDSKGKKYLDASSGSAAVSNLGHGIEGIDKVILDQINKISILPTHGFNSPVIEEYVSELISFSSNQFDRAWTTMSGSEAVENALKLALQYHQLKGDEKRHKIISRWNTYHGNSIFTLDIGGMKLRRQLYNCWMNNFPHVSPAYSYRKAPNLSESEYVFSLISEFEETIQKNDPSTIAAFIAEPVVAAAMGAVPPPNGYFKEISKICKKYGILFISDEILTGFGRLGSNFGYQNFGFQPDIVAAGKGISGGYYPLSAILATEEVMEPFIRTQSAFLGGHTFACNPVGAAVGSFVIEYMKKNRVVENAKEKGTYLLERLKGLEKHAIVGDVRGMGLLLGVEFVMDKVTKEPFDPTIKLSKLIGDKCIDKGVILYPGKGSVDGYKGDHIMISPPLTLSKQECDEIVNTLDECIVEVMNEL
jgi:adenosylmethionine-8-amino-7-oxononanoate aminotransferase